VSIRRPPSAPLRRQNDYALPHDSRWTRIKLSIGRFFLRRIGVPHDATDMLRSAMKLGNPTKTDWPAETLPMNSRLFASGFWNYSFFQFNRKFLPPLWAEEQYNPKSDSFLPRSHNILSMNQTQRNWVAIGFPGRAIEASIDMAGGLMVFPGSYTIEFATLENGRLLRPQSGSADVKLELKAPHRIICKWRSIAIEYTATATGIEFRASGTKPLLLSVRPFNFEGPALLYKLHYNEKKKQLTGDAELAFEKAPDHSLVSDLQNGDALRRIVPRVRRLRQKQSQVRAGHDVKDSFGLTTAAFYFAAADRCEGTITDNVAHSIPPALAGKSARDIEEIYFTETLTANLPKGYGDWLEHAKNHMITLWDYDSIKPGSYTYHHFWIRDAVIMMYALLLMGAKKAVRPIIERFANMVKPSGLFESQTGEWDANGQALWILAQYVRFTHDTAVITQLKGQIEKMIGWIEKTAGQHGGVLPPGFSAEHLGPADWYLWDNFWTLGGLKQITPFLKQIGLEERAEKLYTRVAGSVNRYLSEYSYIPAALGRGKDAGMIGSIAAAYPLQIAEFSDERMLRTLSLIKENYFFDGCFFQENIHSGLNPYLTLQMAESYLYFGRTNEARRILRSIFQKAQKCYTFPEAIHVRTAGGCMGDGFHGWASAEAIIMIRNLVLREITLSDGRQAVIWLSGFRDKWLKSEIKVKNIYTPWSRASLEMQDGKLRIKGLSSAVVQLFSLPKGSELLEDESGQPLRKLPARALGAASGTEREYFLLDHHGDSARLTIVFKGSNEGIVS
jgi:hypothetical protein